MKFPEPIEQLIKHFNRLPSIGPKTAERLALSLLRRNRQELLGFAKSLALLQDNIHYCSICHNLTEINPCLICQNNTRDRQTLCVVAKPQELLSVENTGDYNGQYHVLWGYLSALEGTTPDMLKIRELIMRLDNNPEIKEIILAFNLSLEGESTILYLTKLLTKRGLKISRLARGLSTGSELEYADDITIKNAIKWRTGI